MDIKEVAQICHTIAKENNFILTCPITTNGRFTRCLGRVTYSTRFPERYRTRCCNATLKVQQNW